MLSWFTRDTPGLIERRCDTYRLDGQFDIGVKRRSGKTLELKLRVQPPEPFTAGHNLNGRLEVWQRWSPADRRIYLNAGTIWTDIDKTVIKRRFDANGREQPLSELTRAMTGAGCDAEIATVSVNDRKAWTFAFAAFGPLDRHKQSLAAAWNSLVDGQTHPQRLRLQSADSYGYPEWMSKAAPLPLPTWDMALAAEDGR